MSFKEQRNAILRKHARTGAGGGLSLCLTQLNGHRSGKVIFPTAEAARSCADELMGWSFALKQRVYRCPNHDHFHLTKRLEPGAPETDVQQLRAGKDGDDSGRRPEPLRA